EILLSEKGFYFTLLLFGLFAVVALQKSVRDKIEGVPVTPIFYTIGWIGTLASITLLTIGLINAEMLLSEKGFYAISYLLSLFAAVSVQKNVRDLENFSK
ncbi:MAG: inner membrane protein YiaA, partial [Flavobacterium sp.]